MSAPQIVEYLDRLAAIAWQRDDVVGVVAFGSTADRHRADEWSDHDVAWLTIPGSEDRYRRDLSWLPDSEHIALSVVEHHGGVKVIFDNGHRLEFGIAAVDDFATWAGAPAAVVVGDASVSAATSQVIARRPEGPVDAAREIALVVTQLHAGVGRARRGETVSASGLVRFEAVGHLTHAIGARLPGEVARLDPLDPRRRFDEVFPDVAARLEEAVRLPVEEAARALIDLAERVLEPQWADFPRRGVTALRARYGWS